MNPSQPPKPSLLQSLVIATVVPLFLLATLEVGARAFEPFWSRESSKAAASPKGLEMPTWMLREANSTTRPRVTAEDLAWLKLFTEGDGFRVSLIPNSSAEIQNTFSLIPNDRARRRHIKANSIGFRGPEVAPRKPANTFRVLVFGDSSSFGWGVEEGESWSSLLQKTLQQRYPSTTIEVANFAIPGDSSAYGRLLFDVFAPQYEADAVVLGFGANDAKPVVTPHTEQVARFRQKQGLLKISALLHHSALYRGLEQALAPRRAPAVSGSTASTAPKVPAVSPRDYAANMIYMTERAKELGAKEVILLTLCTPANYSREARIVARKLKVSSLNGQGQLLRLIPKIKEGSAYPEYAELMQASYPSFLRRNDRFYVTSDGCHPNELGHRFIADQLARLIEGSALIRDPAGAPAA